MKKRTNRESNKERMSGWKGRKENQMELKILAMES